MPTLPVPWPAILCVTLVQLASPIFTLVLLLHAQRHRTLYALLAPYVQLGNSCGNPAHRLLTPFVLHVLCVFLEHNFNLVAAMVGSTPSAGPARHVQLASMLLHHAAPTLMQCAHRAKPLALSISTSQRALGFETVIAQPVVLRIARRVSINQQRAPLVQIGCARRVLPALLAITRRRLAQAPVTLNASCVPPAELGSTTALLAPVWQSRSASPAHCVFPTSIRSLRVPQLQTQFAKLALPVPLG